MVDQAFIQTLTSEESPIEFSDSALIAIREVAHTCIDNQLQGLRVFIVGEGCAGYRYGLDFTDIRELDFIIDYEGLKILIDPIAAFLLEGVLIDYQIGIAGSGFKFSNPYAKTTCGCGSSFSL